MPELPKATWDGSTLTLGSEQQYLEGPFKERVYEREVVVGGRTYYTGDSIMVYEDLTRLERYIGVNPGEYWFSFPDEAGYTRRDTTKIRTYARAILNAPEPQAEVANLDDSYSLRDIVDFKTNVATVTIQGNHDWVDENTVRLATNTMMQFRPSTGWAAIISIDDETLTVNQGENLTTMGRSDDDNLVTLDKLQFVAQDGSIDVYSGDFKTPSSEGAFTYTGAFAWEGVSTVETWTGEPFAEYAKGYTLEIRKSAANIETGAAESYSVRVLYPWNSKPDWANAQTPQGGFSTLAEAQAHFNQQKEKLISDAATLQAEYDAKEEAEKEAARAGAVIGSESRGNRVYTIKYSKDGKYIIENKEGLIVAVFDADDDTAALKRATGEIDAYEAVAFPKKDVNWGVIVAAVVGLGAVVGLIIWLRMRKEA